MDTKKSNDPSPNGFAEVRGRFDLLTGAASLQQKYEWLHLYARELGFTDTFYGRTSLLTDPDDPAGKMKFLRWDPEWAELYERRRFQRHDEALMQGQRWSVPFVIQRPSHDLSSAQLEFYKAARHYNRLGGVAVPVSHKDGSVSGFSATGLKAAPSRALIAELRAAVAAFDDEVGMDIAHRAASQLKISPRARLWLMCLRDGMNHVQAAEFLGVSEVGAHKSYARLRDKFDASSDSQLLFKAAQAGLLAGDSR
ncbi:MAG: autoinducer binding domain-containing protein [Pseudomonadota bacterium]